MIALRLDTALSLRREYQVKRVIQGVGRGGEQGDGPAMMSEWVGIGAIERRTREELGS